MRTLAQEKCYSRLKSLLEKSQRYTSYVHDRIQVRIEVLYYIDGNTGTILLGVMTNAVKRYSISLIFVICLYVHDFMHY